MLNITDFKVVLMGDACVGKTSMIQQYSIHNFETDISTETTISASYASKLVETSIGSVQLNIWDTAGQERYRSLIPMYSRGAIAAIIVLDVTNRSSYERIENWFHLIVSNCSPDCKVYVAANKIDLKSVISMEELEETCMVWSLPLFKTSAKELRTVAPLFEKIAEDLIRNLKKPTDSTVEIIREQNRNGCCK
jgi:small GTP-binding protein